MVNWLSTSPSSGSGYNTISVTALPNTGETRNANILISGNETSVSISVEQKSEGTVADWLSLSLSAGTNSDIIAVTASPNPGLIREKTLFVSGNTRNAVINITQEATLDESGYLTFNIRQDGSIRWSAPNTLSYSVNNGVWTDLYSGQEFYAYAGDIIRFRSDFVTTSWDEQTGHYTATTFNNSTAEYDVYGNIMSLVSSSSFNNLTSLPYPYCFASLFEGTKVVNASGLTLPATTLTKGCYSQMFNMCRQLVSVPQLPATTMADACYLGMFGDCTALTTTPVLSATALAASCYDGMFWNCYSLASAPALPATTLANWCYMGMFAGCTGLTTAPVLSATTLVEGCYNNMFANCYSLTTAPALPATTLANYCYSSMFADCPGLTTAPVLSATTLVQECYYNMFAGCTNLNYVKCLATDHTAKYCTNNWLQNVASAGTFVKASSATWNTGIHGIPNNWTVQNA